MLLRKEGLIFIFGREERGRNMDWEIELEGLVREEVLESWR